MNGIRRYEQTLFAGNTTAVSATMCLSNDVDVLEAELTRLRNCAIPESWKSEEGPINDHWKILVEDCVKQVSSIANEYQPNYRVVMAILNANADILQLEHDAKMLEAERDELRKEVEHLKQERLRCHCDKCEYQRMMHRESAMAECSCEDCTYDRSIKEYYTKFEETGKMFLPIKITQENTK
jgi:hypothetical protein